MKACTFCGVNVVRHAHADEWYWEGSADGEDTIICIRCWEEEFFLGGSVNSTITPEARAAALQYLDLCGECGGTAGYAPSCFEECRCVEDNSGCGLSMRDLIG